MQLSQKEVLESIRNERGNLEWIENSMPLLMSEYADQYIAVAHQEVVDSDRDFEALLARLRKRYDPNSLTIEHISSVENAWIL